MNDSQESISEQLLALKEKTSWSWEAMCREFHRVMGKEGPSNTTLFRYASGKVKRRNSLVERYVFEALHKVEIELVQKELTESENQRKNIEQDLKGTEARFRELVENAKDTIYRYRILPTRGFEYISPAVTDITGYTPEEYYADPELFVKISHPDDSKEHEETREGDHQFHQLVVRRIRHKDGRWKWTERVHIPIHDDKGVVIALEGISRDITERKETEASQAFLASIVESSDDAIMSVALDGTITSWNPASEKLLGYPAAEVIGQRISLIHPDAKRFDSIHARLSSGERVNAPETVVVSKTGEKIKVSITSSPIQDRQGQILGFSGTISDLREPKPGDTR
ncbi:MAG: PAS domain S-box protein [Acidobacteriota bacterium]